MSIMPKQGFSAPDTNWYKDQNGKMIMCIFEDDNNPLFDILNKYELKKLAIRHLNGLENNRLFFWSLLNLNEFFSQFK